MTRTRIVGLLVAAAALFLGGEAAAQIPNCGSTSNYNDIWQPGGLRYVEATFRTQRSIVGCAAYVRVEGYINGSSGSFAEGAYTAEFSLGRPVQFYGSVKDSYSHHWWIWLGGLWENLGSQHDQVQVLPPDPMPPPREDCEMNGGIWDETLEYCDGPFSPIILDTAHDGIRLTNSENGVRFDLNNDGFPELVAWTHEGSDDAWLAMDRNGNGTIDNGSELFGNVTPIYIDRTEPTADNGFEALKFTEHPSYGAYARDAVIDANDAVFARLLLWRDANHNGVSEADELAPLGSSGVISIAKDYRLIKRRDRHGNEFRQKGKAWFLMENGVVVSDAIFDVWLRHAPGEVPPTP